MKRKFYPKTMNNPVLYVTIGQELKIWPDILTNLNEFAIQAAHMLVPPGFEEDEIREEIAKAWKNFLHWGNNSDMVRVVYLVGTCPNAIMLPQLRAVIEKYISTLYPAGILSDIFCILDDVTLLDMADERGGVLQMLEQEQQGGQTVYLLSNLTSDNQLLPQQSVTHTIAMLALFKDNAPVEYVAEADASRYNELYFLDNCYARSGIFLTAGSAKIAIPEEKLHALIMVELLAYGQNNPTEIKPSTMLTSTGVTPAATPGLEYFLYMAIPELEATPNLARRQWLTRLYGQRLEGFDLTPTGAAAEFSIQQIAGFYDLLHHTAPGGICDTVLQTAISDAATSLQTAENALQNWLDSPVTEQGKRKLSPFVCQDLWPYTIAQNYVQQKADITCKKEELHILQTRRQQLQAIHQDILEKQNIVQLAMKNENATMDDNFANYFKKQFSAFAAENTAQLHNLAEEKTQALTKGEFSKHLQGLKNYAQETIMPSKHFNKPIITVLQEIYPGQDLSDIICNWILNQRRWNIRLKTGYSGLHTEVNLYMPPQTAQETKHIYQERALGRMNLFTHKNAKSISVLYHAGSFNPQDLYSHTNSILNVSNWN